MPARVSLSIHPMKTSLLLAITAVLASAGISPLLAEAGYTNFVRQVQLGTKVQWDVVVPSKGTSVSPLAVDALGTRFELWTVKSGDPPVSYLLDNSFVGTFSPEGSVAIATEDKKASPPRTRADRPFDISIEVRGLLNGADVPDGAKALKLLRHVQSYGTKGTGSNIDRGQATLLSQTLLTTNGTIPLSYDLTSIPGGDRTKIRGEERFSLYTVDTNEQLASKTVQIWPVADGGISGLTDGTTIRMKMPPLTVSLNDLYPESNTYVQVYKGAPALGTSGRIVPGSSLVVRQNVPEDRVLLLEDYDAVFDDDGKWTMELLTTTPFGTDRLAYLSFTIDRTITVNGTVTTCE